CGFAADRQSLAESRGDVPDQNVGGRHLRQADFLRIVVVALADRQAGLDRNVVVAVADVEIGKNGVVDANQIHAVTVAAESVNRDAGFDYIAAVTQCLHPVRLVLQRDPFDCDVVALIELEYPRASGHVHGVLHGGHILPGASTVMRVRLVACAIDDAGPEDGDVGRPLGRDQCLVRLIHPVDICGHVAAVLVGRLQGHTLVDVQMNVALEGDRTGDIDGVSPQPAELNRSAALRGTGIDGVLNGDSVVGSSICDGPEVDRAAGWLAYNA